MILHVQGLWQVIPHCDDRFYTLPQIGKISLKRIQATSAYEQQGDS